MAFTPHGFNKSLPYIKLTPYVGGFIDAQSLSDVSRSFTNGTQAIIKNLNSKPYKIFDELNKVYYGPKLDPKHVIYIPITESFIMNGESDYESLNPFSSFSGSFGGAFTMIGANVLGVNNVMGKVWSGSNIGIGNFSFHVAVDTSEPLKKITEAVTQNKEYIDTLKELFLVSRSPGDQGVLQPPRICQLKSSFGFSRKWVGIKKIDIQTVGMWDDKKTPIAYNITVEVDDLVLGREADKKKKGKK